MFKPVEVRALPDYKIWAKFSDGTEGKVDLSHLAGKGVFSIWNEYGDFENVYVAEHGAIAWNDDIDICSDSIYLKLTGKSAQESFPKLRKEEVDA